MNPIIIVFSLIGFVFTAFSIRIISLTALGDTLFIHPWWIYLVAIGIVVSGCMAILCNQEERHSGKAPMVTLFKEPRIFSRD